MFLWFGVLYKSKIFAKKEDLFLNVTILKSSNTLKTLDDSFKIKSIKHVKIDKLYFPKRKYLYHYLYGNLRFNKNFVMKINTAFMLENNEKVKFVISSDDGFRLTIDGKKICEYVKDRPMSKTECVVNLKKGKHKMFIKYFQGYGQLGLVGVYEINGKKYYIGQNSDYLRFYENN